MIPFWTEADIEKLRSLWLEGMSARKIGLEMGRTRNAIIGKRNRLGLSIPTRDRPPRERRRRSKGLSDAQRANKVRNMAKFRMANVFTLPIPKAKIQSKGVGFMEWKPALECAFIVDDREPGGVRCGNRTHGTESWCYDHCRIVYQVFP